MYFDITKMNGGLIDNEKERKCMVRYYKNKKFKGPCDRKEKGIISINVAINTDSREAADKLMLILQQLYDAYCESCNAPKSSIKDCDSSRDENDICLHITKNYSSEDNITNGYNHKIVSLLYCGTENFMKYLIKDVPCISVSDTRDTMCCI